MGSTQTMRGAWAADPVVRRCADMRLNQSAPEMIGYALKRTKLRGIDIGDRSVVVQPLMMGMKGPRVTLPGRDVRLAVTTRQSSPQELWHKAAWNAEIADACTPPRQPWFKKLKHGLYWKAVLDSEAGYNHNSQPRVLYRTRGLLEGLMVQPYGFTFGAGLSVPLATNAEALLTDPDPRRPVRRDMARFANGGGLERLFASWRTTPITDVHFALSAGWLEEMYGGVGMETIWRPFGSPFWVGADAWRVWRRDPDHVMNLAWTNDASFSGHVRAGYEIPDTNWTLSAAAGRYLAGDYGATLAARRDFDNGMRLEAGVTWSDRRERDGFFRDAKFNPMLRLTTPLSGSKKHEARMRLHQVGRDGGQMLDRPLPLEDLTERFSTRAYIRHWPEMFD